MAELLTFWEVRTLMTDALQVVNDMDDGASSELHTGLRRRGQRRNANLDPNYC
jgi:hypothetical protein